MKNPLLAICRQLALSRNRSTLPTGLLPLSQVHGAVVYVDALAADEDPVNVCRAIRQFFDHQGIPVLILCPEKSDFNLLGYLRKRSRGSRESLQEELFISLAGSPECFAAEYEARCSTARFKVGRFKLTGDVFDLVVDTPESGEATQEAVFAAIKDYLGKIR